MSTFVKKLQIGVMGSAADLSYSKQLESMAFDTGKYVAQNGSILVYGAEKDVDSLSTAAARGAKSAGGVTVAITYGKGKDIWGGGESYSYRKTNPGGL